MHVEYYIWFDVIFGIYTLAFGINSYTRIYIKQQIHNVCITVYLTLAVTIIRHKAN